MNMIVPANVLDRYLEGYSSHQITELHSAYYAVRAAAINAVSPLSATPKKELTMTAGAEGVGKSTYLKKLVETQAQAGNRMALIDWEGILPSIPSYMRDRANLHDYFMVCAEGNVEARKLTRQWVNGAKWVGDMVLNDLAYLGLPVAFETTAHNSKIADFLGAFHDAGYKINMHLGDAPMDIKVGSANRHHQEDQTPFVEPAEIQKKSADIIRNLALYGEHADTLTLLWRESVTSPLKPFAYSGGHKVEAKVMDSKAAQSFDAAHQAHDNEISVQKLLESHIYFTAQRERENGHSTEWKIPALTGGL